METIKFRGKKYKKVELQELYQNATRIKGSKVSAMVVKASSSGKTSAI